MDLNKLMNPPEPEPSLQRFVAAANDDEKGILLWIDGEDIEREVEAVGIVIDDHSELDYTPGPGLWVWEGHITYSGGNYNGYSGDYADPDVHFNGEYRRPTDEEWAKIKLGESPWPPRPGSEEVESSDPD